jgi:hypothetical protein
MGGYDELAMLEREGKLDAWLANEPEMPVSERLAPEPLADVSET